MLRVGIISAAWGAQTHLPAWRVLADDVEVTAICTSRQETAEAAAAEHGIARPFWDYRAMAADPDIDILDCGTRPLWRQDMVAAALANGKHAVNQVPFAVSAEAGRAMRDQQQAAGLKGMVAASVLGLPQLGLMKEMIAAEYLGELFQVNCQWQASYFNPAIPGFPWAYFADPDQGVSVTRNQGSHMLHALRELFGPIASVTAQMHTFVKEWDLGPDNVVTVRSDDTMNALLRFANGALGQMGTSWVATDSPGFFIEAIGRRGRLRLESSGYPNPEAARLFAAEPNFVGQTATQVPLPERLMTVDGQLLDPAHGSQVASMARLYRQFVDAIKTGGDHPGSFARAAEVQSIVEAFYRSSAERRWIDVA